MNILGCLGLADFGLVPLRRGGGRPPLARPAARAWRRNYLGFVFQGFNLLGRSTALENVELPLVYRGLSASTGSGARAKALEQVGLESRARPARTSSPAVSNKRVAMAARS